MADINQQKRKALVNLLTWFKAQDTEKLATHMIDNENKSSNMWKFELGKAFQDTATSAHIFDGLFTLEFKVEEHKRYKNALDKTWPITEKI